MQIITDGKKLLKGTLQHAFNYLKKRLRQIRFCRVTFQSSKVCDSVTNNSKRQI